MTYLPSPLIARLFFFLRTIDDAINLVLVCKKCLMSSLSLLINPYYPMYPHYSKCVEARDERKDVLRELRLFPKIQILQFRNELQMEEIQPYNFIRVMTGKVPFGLESLRNKMVKQIEESFFAPLSTSLRQLYITIAMESLPDSQSCDGNVMLQRLDCELKNITNLQFLQTLKLRFVSRNENIVNGCVLQSSTSLITFNDRILWVADHFKNKAISVIFELDFPNPVLLIKLKQLSTKFVMVTSNAMNMDKNYL
ncbi:Hypothetical protein EIN_223120, partial [Entamoeba invadens IP1]